MAVGEAALVPSTTVRVEPAIFDPNSTHAVTPAAISSTMITTASTTPFRERAGRRTVGAPTSTPLPVIPAGTRGGTMFIVDSSFAEPPPVPDVAATGIAATGATAPIGTVLETTRLFSSTADTPLTAAARMLGLRD